MNDRVEDSIDKIRNAIEQRRKDGYPEDFRISDLFNVTLGDIAALVDETLSREKYMAYNETPTERPCHVSEEP